MNPILAKFSSIAMGCISDTVPAFGVSDPLGVTNFFKNVYRKQSDFFQGTIVTYNPNTHTASVSVANTQSMWSCIFADEFLSYSFGFSETHPPKEGEQVLVVPVGVFSQSGIIIGRVPYLLYYKVDKYNDPDHYHRRLYTQDDLDRTTWDKNVPCYIMPLQEKNDDSTHTSTHFRPTDVYPGEFANVNQHNCGIKGGLFSATLLGGGANLRMSALTNTARLSCESYIRHSMLGNLKEFHNGRYLSLERDLAVYQEERLGGSEKRAKVWTDDAEAPEEGEDQTIRPRIKDLSGYFGNLVARFCLRPDPNEKGIRIQGDTPFDEGVSRETVDPSGQYRLSAAGMIAIERTGRIPVPVRIAYPTDKDHDIPSNPERPTPERLTPFKHSDKDPCYRQLELFDRQAYDLKTQYARVDGLGVDHPDHFVPQEDELEPLKDKYDEKFTNSETVKLQKFDKRRAGMYIGEDGSVIIRDAWGSEIVMLGGNITMSCAGNVMVLPGKTALTIAGDDIVQKAQNSIDIHASEHDVRLSAARNMEILGGGDENEYRGGVIIESRGKYPMAWDGEDKGESAQLSGIVLKTNNQAVVVDGKEVHLRSKDRTRILSGDNDIDGEISVGAKMIRMRGENSIISSGDAAVNVSKSVLIVGTGINIGAKSGLTLTSGSKVRIPFKMEEAESIYDKENPYLDESTSDLADEKYASMGFERESLNKMMFGFRTSQECGTEEPWSIGGSGKFKMYEPAWVQVMKIYETLKNANVSTKKYEEKADWKNGRPFPGKKAEDSGKYAQLSGLKPNNLTLDGFNASRKDVKDESNVEEVSIKEYLIRK